MCARARAGDPGDPQGILNPPGRTLITVLTPGAGLRLSAPLRPCRPGPGSCRPPCCRGERRTCAGRSPARPGPAICMPARSQHARSPARSSTPRAQSRMGGSLTPRSAPGCLRHWAQERWWRDRSSGCTPPDPSAKAQQTWELARAKCRSPCSAFVGISSQVTRHGSGIKARMTISDACHRHHPWNCLHTPAPR